MEVDLIFKWVVVILSNRFQTAILIHHLATRKRLWLQFCLIELVFCTSHKEFLSTRPTLGYCRRLTPLISIGMPLPPLRYTLRWQLVWPKCKTVHETLISVSPKTRTPWPERSMLISKDIKDYIEIKDWIAVHPLNLCLPLGRLCYSTWGLSSLCYPASTRVYHRDGSAFWEKSVRTKRNRDPELAGTGSEIDNL